MPLSAFPTGIAGLQVYVAARGISVLNPGAWVHTDDRMSNILEIRPAGEEQPHAGTHWWRVQTLLHEFGVTV